MTILVVSQYYAPDITAAAFRLSEMVEIMRRRGHRVVVVTSEPHRASAGEASVNCRRNGATTDEEVHRVRPTPLDGSGIRPYLRHYFSFVRGARRAAARIVADGFVPDFLWVTSPPLFVGLVGTFLKRRTGAPLVIDIRDVWPDTAVAAGQIAAGGRAYRFGRLLERWLYRRATALTCVAAPMAAYLREYAGDRPVVVAYNGVASGDGVARPQREVSRSEPERMILYAGNLGRLQGVDTLIRAWNAVRHNSAFAGWHVEIAGNGVMADELRTLATELGVDESVRFLGTLTKESAAARAENAGILYLNLVPNPVFDLTIPSKLFDYLLAARPIIAGITGEGAEIVNRNAGNRVVPPNDHRALAETLRDVVGFAPDGSPPPAMTENRDLVLSAYTREAAVDAVLGVFPRIKSAPHDATRRDRETR